MQAFVGTAPRVGAVALAWGLVLASALVMVSGGEVGQLVHAAPPAADPAAVPPNLALRSPDEGYDGMFFYRLAVSPLSTAERVNGVRHDAPAMRTSRVLYPALAGAASLGDDARVPWMLLVVNVAAFGVVGYFGALVAVDLGRRPAWGLLFAAYPGFVYTLGHDLGELTEAAFVLVGLHLLCEKRFVVAGLALSGAVLAKETGIILPLGLGLAWAWARMAASQNKRAPNGQTPLLVTAVPAALPGVVFVGWQLFLGSRFGAVPMSANADNNIRWPLAGFSEVADRFVPTSAANLFRSVSLAVLVLVAVAASMVWRHSRTDLGVRLAWIGAVVLLFVISEHVYAGATAFMRAGTESYVLGVVLILGAERRRVLLPAAIGAITALTISSELIKAT